MPQAASRYRQTQEWHPQPTALLLLVDWFHSGRTDQGERFAFTSLHSELRVRVAGGLVVLDWFGFQPEEHIVAAPTNFAGYQTFFRSSWWAAQLMRGSSFWQRCWPGRKCPAVRGRTPTSTVGNAWVLRAAAHSRMALQPLCDEILAALADDELLGYNPLVRKY